MGELGERETSSGGLLSLLDAATWQALRGEMDERAYEPGSVVVAQGEIDADFHVIAEGIARVVATTPDGRERELGRIGAGECAGEMSLLTGEPASAAVVAMTRLRTHAASQSKLASLGTIRTDLVEALSAILAGRLKHANERLLAMHPANVYAICVAPEDLPYVAGIAAAMRRATGARTLVLAADAAHQAIADKPASAARFDLRQLDGGDLATLPSLLARVGHDYEEILLVGSEEECAHAAGDVESTWHVVRRGAAGDRHTRDGDLIVIADEGWTPRALRRLSEEYGRIVAGVLPMATSGLDHDDAIGRLARLVTKRRIGLALGAGAAKAISHLGVLRALAELRVPIDVVSGCSAGAAIAAGVANKLPLDELTDITLRTLSRSFRPTLPVRSFLSNAGVKDELRRFAGDTRIEDLELPLAVVATDIFRRAEVTFTSGLVWPRLVASMALPGVYPPTAALGSYLVDGGVLNPVPVRQCRELGAGTVIGVRLTGTRTSPREQLDVRPGKPFAVETVMRTFEIMLNRISEVSNEQADVNITVTVDGGGGLRDIKRGDEIAQVGYETAMRARGEIEAAIPSARGEAGA